MCVYIYTCIYIYIQIEYSHMLSCDNLHIHDISLSLSLYIYIYIGVKDLPLRDMISLGAWRTGLGCSGKILPSSPSPSSSSPTRIWEMGNYQSSLRLRRFRNARIDPSRLPSAEGYTKNIKFPYEKVKYQKRVEKRSQTAKNRHSIINPLEKYPSLLSP